MFGQIEPLKDSLIQVVIETPRGSVYKYSFNPASVSFHLDKILPVGQSFPFDFGFLPNTKGEDGDPLDVLLLGDQPICQGAVVPARLVGVLHANQRERDGHQTRNDRYVAVCAFSHIFQHVLDLKDLSSEYRQQIESFFIYYNQLAGKAFQPIGWESSANALTSLKKWSPIYNPDNIGV